MARPKRNGPPESSSPTKSGCVICGSFEALTRHHWVPRTLHSRNWFRKAFTKEQRQHTSPICRPCHDQIHRCIEEKDLGRLYNTLEKLLAHPEISKWQLWRKRRIK
ncbi:MAG: hypothetical protein AB1705_11365 [Verrucomicrobiota bacterium]